MTLRWDAIPPESLDSALTFLRAKGLAPYFIIEPWEHTQFKTRFALAQQRENKGQGADGANERLADVDPGGDQVGDRCDVRCCGENNHVRLQVFSQQATREQGAWEPSPLRGETRKLDGHPCNRVSNSAIRAQPFGHGWS